MAWLPSMRAGQVERVCRIQWTDSERQHLFDHFYRMRATEVHVLLQKTKKLQDPKALRIRRYAEQQLKCVPRIEDALQELRALSVEHEL